MAAALVVAAGGCAPEASGSGAPASPAHAARPAGAAEATAPAGGRAAEAPAPAAATAAELVHAPASTGPLEASVREEAARAASEGRRLVVYVGASWCEPCRRFHEAVEAGRIAGPLADLRFLELDWDRDEARLAAAGYGTRLLPLFAVPGPDGRSTGRHLEGAVKGEGAVGWIVPRLEALLAGR